MDKIRVMIRYDLRFILFLSVLLFLFQTNSVLAKSTNKNDFFILFKEAYTLQKEGKKEKAYLLRLK